MPTIALQISLFLVCVYSILQILNQMTTFLFIAFSHGLLGANSSNWPTKPGLPLLTCPSLSLNGGFSPFPKNPKDLESLHSLPMLVHLVKKKIEDFSKTTIRHQSCLGWLFVSCYFLDKNRAIFFLYFFHFTYLLFGIASTLSGDLSLNHSLSPFSIINISSFIDKKEKKSSHKSC